MKEIYVPNERKTSTVQIDPRAAQDIGGYFSAVLFKTSYVDVTAIPIARHNELTRFSGKLEDSKPRMATSLRWLEDEDLPARFSYGIPILRCYDRKLDTYISYLALPELGFNVSPTYKL